MDVFLHLNKSWNFDLLLVLWYILVPRFKWFVCEMVIGNCSKYNLDGGLLHCLEAR